MSLIIQFFLTHGLLLNSYLSGDGSSLMTKKTGHKDTLDEEYKGAPSVLKIRLMLDGSLKNCPSSHSLA